MRVYHGSLELVASPEIREPNRTLDYGSGFYTTTSSEQAESWVRRKMNEQQKAHGFVNLYEFDESYMHKFNCLVFEEPTEDWVDFVMKNRVELGFHHDFDIVYGPVANDRVYAAFALFEGGVLNKEELIHELKAYELVDQYLFHTERSLVALSFIEGKEVRNES